jgi:hypothetical protein
MINSLDHKSSTFIAPLTISSVELSRDAKSYIKGREGKHLKSISQQVVQQEM